MNIINRLRLKMGLRWAKSRPPFPWRSIATVAACAVVYSVIAHIDDLEARTVEMERHWTGQFAQCLNGQWRGVTDAGTQIACLPAESYNPKRGS